MKLSTNNVLKRIISLAFFGTCLGILLMIPQGQAFACWSVLPDVSSATPSVAKPGQTVTIAGGTFQPGQLVLYYGNDQSGWNPLPPASVQNISDTQLQFRAPTYTIANSLLYVHDCGGSSSKPIPFAVISSGSFLFRLQFTFTSIMSHIAQIVLPHVQASAQR